MTFYDNLNRILGEKNIKKVQLEKDLGITKGNFYTWKNGADPTAKYIIMLSNYLNVTSDELLGLPDRKKEAEEPPGEEASPNITEAITLFRQLPDREQIKFIGRLEDAVNQ